jgi:hypothetical protein
VDNFPPDEDVDPAIVDPPHPEFNPDYTSQLVARMWSDGWKGRPLLVHRDGMRYIAWMGTHRIFAARKAKVMIPVVYLNATSLRKAGWPETDLRVPLRQLELADAGDPRAHDLMAVERVKQQLRYTTFAENGAPLLHCPWSLPSE